MVNRSNTGNSRSDFLPPIDEHSINEILMSRSWLRDNNAASKATDDDELINEIKKLSLIEREISEEISRVQIPFKNKSDKKKVRANISNIRDIVDIQLLDCRNDSSFPSDEAFVSYDRESPPGVNSCRSDGSPQFENIEHDSIGMHAGEEEKVDKNPNLSFTFQHSREKDQSAMSKFLKERHDEEQYTGSDLKSGWDIESNQFSDRENDNNLFEEEKFWVGGLWKTPPPTLNKLTSSWNTTVIRSFERAGRNNEANQEESRIGDIIRSESTYSRNRLKEMLFLPTLRYSRKESETEKKGNNNDNDKHNKSEHTERTHTQSTKSTVIDALYEDDSPVCNHKYNGTTLKNSFGIESENENRGINKIGSTIINKIYNDLRIVNEKEKKGSNNKLIAINKIKQHDNILSSRKADDIAKDENESIGYQESNGWCNLRIIVVIIHIALIVIGVFIFYYFFAKNEALM